VASPASTTAAVASARLWPYPESSANSGRKLKTTLSKTAKKAAPAMIAGALRMIANHEEVASLSSRTSSA
jgi:hypothetical protein